MKNGLLSGVAAIALVAAAGASAPGAAAQQAYDWTGFYLGAHLGYGGADFDGVREFGSDSSLSFFDDSFFSFIFATLLIFTLFFSIIREKIRHM